MNQSRNREGMIILVAIGSLLVAFTLGMRVGGEIISNAWDKVWDDIFRRTR